MIDIHEIRRIDVKRQEMKKELYTKIYEQFERKIRQQVELGKDKYVFLQVPSYVLGFPKFDREAAATYLSRQFKRSGFDVEITGVTLLVSWFPKAKKKAKVRPPPVEHEQEHEEALPTLMNLRKAASAYRKV